MVTNPPKGILGALMSSCLRVYAFLCAFAGSSFILPGSVAHASRLIVFERVLVILFTQSPSARGGFSFAGYPIMTNKPSGKSSRLERFYDKSLEERGRIIREWACLSQTDYDALATGGLSPQSSASLIEKEIGIYSLPLGIATNFLINQTEYLIPMVIEEPSVIAACSFAAKLARSGGGFVAWADDPVMIGQIQTLHVPDVDAAAETIMLHQDELLRIANAAHPNLVARGGGARAIEARRGRSSAAGPMLIVHLLIDVRNAMGANIVNTSAEAVAPHIEALTGGHV